MSELEFKTIFGEVLYIPTQIFCEIKIYFIKRKVHMYMSMSLGHTHGSFKQCIVRVIFEFGDVT